MTIPAARAGAEDHEEPRIRAAQAPPPGLGERRSLDVVADRHAVDLQAVAERVGERECVPARHVGRQQDAIGLDDAGAHGADGYAAPRGGVDQRPARGERTLERLGGAVGGLGLQTGRFEELPAHRRRGQRDLGTAEVDAEDDVCDGCRSGSGVRDH